MQQASCLPSSCYIQCVLVKCDSARAHDYITHVQVTNVGNLVGDSAITKVLN